MCFDQKEKGLLSSDLWLYHQKEAQQQHFLEDCGHDFTAEQEEISTVEMTSRA